ncbi:hypothetical protein ACGFIX_14390 [Nocardia salmonicida]|uniref:hypothetical protein n=1 Tax=Nocardia salmonicida TaxID=53431 RepID=UPI003718BBB5
MTSFESAMTTDADHRDRARQRLLHRYLGWPFIAVIAFEIACKSLLLVAAIVEVPLVSSALAMVLPTAGELTIDLGGVAVLIIYAALWHHLGVRVAESTHAPNKRTGPGATNWALAAALSAMMLALAVLRTTTLADSAARRAVATAIATTVDVPDPGMLAEIERTAWWSAFWPDSTFTVTLMTMLALLALLIGYHSPIRHQALSLHLARHNATRARAKAARARAAADHAARQADAQLHAATARWSHATALTTALTDRFTRAKHLARHLITEHQASPDSTTTIFPPDKL